MGMLGRNRNRADAKTEEMLAKAQSILEATMGSYIRPSPATPIEKCEVVAGTRELSKDLEVEWKNAPASE